MRARTNWPGSSAAFGFGNSARSAAVTAFVDWLFEDPLVSEVIADPAPDNLRAIHCFRNAGFIARQVVKTPDGPALLMRYRRP
mgnify:CR=1 FL=1